MPFKIQIAEGCAVEVEEQEFILEALIAKGINHPYSCRQGICTSCRVRVISGVIEHDASESCALGPRQIESGYRLLCISHARSDATIEVG